MASAPSFTATPRIGVAAVSTANTNRDGTGTIATVLTAATGGTKVFEIALQATGDPADSTVTLFLHDGTDFWLFDEFDLGNPAAATTAIAGYRVRRTYENLVLPNGWSIRAAVTVAPVAGVINVYVFAGDF